MRQEILPPLPANPEAMDEIAADELPEELAFTPVEQQAKRWSGINAQKQRLFIAQLAFRDPALVEQAKLGILLASAASATIGLAWLVWAGGKKA